LGGKITLKQITPGGSALRGGGNPEHAGLLGRFLCLALLGVLTSSACGPRPQDCASPSVFCVGLVTDFGTVSEGIAREAWLAVQDAKAAGLVDRADYIETLDSRDRAANVATFADAGYDVVVTSGSAMSDATTAAARKYATLEFIGVEQPQPEQVPNLTGLVFHEERSGFLAGALAAMITTTGRIAAVCEAKYVDPIRRYCDGFQTGAEFARRDVSVTVSYRDGAPELLFRDNEWGAATAVQQVNEGADIIFAAGAQTADAALVAAARAGALVMGTETDVYERLPSVRAQLVTSAINDIRSGVLDLLQLVRKGGLPDGEYAGQVGLAPYHDQDGRIPSDTRTRIEDIRSRLLSGTLRLDVPYEAP
jgi:basic membrane protein A